MNKSLLNKKNIEEEKENLFYNKYYEYIISVPKNIRTVIFSFVDIFTLGKFGLCNKKLYELVYNENNLNTNNAKIYISAIFANSKLYDINLQKIKVEYKNSFIEMLKKKPRIKFSGIYYSRIKAIHEYYKFGQENNLSSYSTYYRVLRFFPNGNVYIMTCPHFKIDKIKLAIKEGMIEFKKGKFHIREDNTIFVQYTNEDEYIYRLGWSDFSIYRLGFCHDDPGIQNGIELISYHMKDRYGEKINIKLDENFPKRFRYRSIYYLKNDIYIKKDRSENSYLDNNLLSTNKNDNINSINIK